MQGGPTKGRGCSFGPTTGSNGARVPMSGPQAGVTSEVPEMLCATRVDDMRPARSSQFSLFLPASTIECRVRRPISGCYIPRKPLAVGMENPEPWLSAWMLWRTRDKNDGPKAAQMSERSRIFWTTLPKRSRTILRIVVGSIRRATEPPPEGIPVVRSIKDRDYAGGSAHEQEIDPPCSAIPIEPGPSVGECRICPAERQVRRNYLSVTLHAEKNPRRCVLKVSRRYSH